MTKLPKSLEQKRDELRLQQGDNHANPIIRSIYPSKSRDQMMREFAQLYSLGFDSGALEVKVIAEKLVDAMEAFISKTQDVSKITGENSMKAPEEYVEMLRVLIAWKEMWK